MSFNPTRPYSPPPLPPKSVDLNSVAILKKVAKVGRQMAEINGYCMAVPNPYLTMAPFLIQESVASSNIENINTTVVEFIQGQLFPETEQRPPDKEVARYREALIWGNKKLPDLALSTRLVTGIQKHLLENPEEGYRRVQNKIENSANKTVIYTPPVASEISRHMSEWEKFVNDQNLDIDPLVMCALAHYQFEAIHPFSDGNGRTGRILMVLQLVSSGALRLPVLFISGYLNRYRSEYYRHLNEVTSKGEWNAYIHFMLDAFYSQSLQTGTSLLKIMNLSNELKDAIKTKHKKIYSAELIEHLFIQPITTPVRLGDAIGVHYTTASKYLHALVEGGILKNKRVGKYHFFANTRLVKLLQQGV
jgi:Fic family protein